MAAPGYPSPDQAGAPAADSVDPSLFGGAAATAEGGEAMPRLATRPRMRRERSAIRDMIGAGVGGFLGLALAYYLLNLFGGPQFNMFDIWLPFVKHTYKQPKKKMVRQKLENAPGSAFPNFQKAHDEEEKAKAKPESGAMHQPSGELRLYSAEFVRLITTSHV
jgi:hypothetical protein